MAQQQHHSDQVDDTHDSTGQVIGHVEDLRRLYKEIIAYMEMIQFYWEVLFIYIYLFPLMDVTNEARESEKTQQAEDLGKTDDAEGAGGAVHVSGIKSGLQIDDEEDVINRDGGDKVHHEPSAEVMQADLFGVQDDVTVFSWDARSEIQNQVNEE